jgi:hypothetical protein
VLNSLIRGGLTDTHDARPIGALDDDGPARMGDGAITQENAHAMESLSPITVSSSPVVPDFTAVVKLSGNEIARQRVQPAELRPSVSKHLAMPQVLSRGAAGTSSR